MAREVASEGERQLVVFSLAREVYGVDVSTVREIIRLQEITHVPNTPEFVEGVINLRSKVCPVIDLRKRLDLELGEATDDSRIVVVEIAGEDVGVIVDSVTEVLRVAGDAIEAAPAIASKGTATIASDIVNLEDRLILLVDLGTMIAHPEDETQERAEAIAA